MTDNQESFDIRKIAEAFEISGNYSVGHPYGSGHINDTFYIETGAPNGGRYILQRINHHVFKEPQKLMENVLRVTRHIRAKLEKRGKNPDRHVRTLLPTKEGRYWHSDPDGNVWRLFLFIEDTVGYDIVENPHQAFQGGQAFGEFQSQLVDLPGERLHDTIPNFHNMELRLEAFFGTLRQDPASRVSATADEISFVEKRAHDMSLFQRLGREGKLIERITHNDTKINNVLLDKDTDEAVCVIDLDTVMPGYVLFDFGDSIRTSTNTGAEDDPDLSKVGINLELFAGYTKGYLSKTKEFLSTEEKEQLAYSARVMTFIMGLRFLTDYLDGDNYYKIHHPDHNLHRARAQFALIESMERNYQEMVEIVDRIYEGAVSA